MQEQKLITRIESGLFPLLDLVNSTVANETAFVICSGGSLTKEDVKLVETAQAKKLCTVIAVNNAFQLATNADIVYSLDGFWWTNYYKHVPETSLPISNAFGIRIFPFKDTPRLTYVNTEQPPDVWSDRLDRVTWGQGSGNGAILLASKLKAKRIIILGMDLRGTHFFGKHPAPFANTSPHGFVLFTEQLNDIYDELTARHYALLDATRDGTPRKVPHVKLENILRKL